MPRGDVELRLHSVEMTTTGTARRPQVKVAFEIEGSAFGLIEALVTQQFTNTIEETVTLAQQQLEKSSARLAELARAPLLPPGG